MAADHPRERLADLSEAKRAMLERRLRGIAPAAILRQAESGPAPLLFAQEQLWIVDQLSPGTTAYNLPGVLWLHGPLDRDALERALDEIVRRQQALRTRFPVLDGRPVQLVEPARHQSLPVVDLGSIAPENRPRAARELMAAVIAEPFDLAAGPLCRATLYRLGEREHCLLLLMHHIVADAWSLRVLAEELAAIYGALVSGGSLPPEPQLQPSDVAAWQRTGMRGPAMQAHLDYWQDRLRRDTPPIELPVYRPRPTVPSSRGGVHRHELPADLVEALRQLSLRAKATPYMTMLAAFCALLSRYTGETDVVVGTTVADRGRAGLERVVANLVNTLAIRVDLSGDPGFDDLLGRVRQTVLGAMEHAQAPYPRVVEVVRPARSLSHNPLFQVLFVMQDVSLAPLRAGELVIEAETLDSGTAQFDLALTVQGGLCHYQYSTDLLDPETVARMASHLETLLRAIARGAERPVSRLPVLSAPERRQLLTGWNQTPTPSAADRCIHELFEDKAAEVPDATAVILDAQVLSYAELNRRANQVAHHLRRRGVGADDLVGICLQRSLEMVVAIYGVLKAGAAYVPVDVTHPRQRVDQQLGEAGVRVVLTQERFRPLAAGTGRSTVCLDSEWDLLAREPASNPSRVATPDNLLYVMFTSGSTGQPKGVMTTHRNLVDVMEFLQRIYALTTSDRVLQHLPHWFDMSDGELFLPLLSGAGVVLADPDGHWDPERLLDTIRRQRVTSVQFVPSVFPVLLEGDAWDSCTSLRHVLSGGDALLADVANELLRRTEGVVHNFYGPTETTMGMTYWRCEPLERHRIAPIGKAIDNTRTYVLDRWLEPVPVGVTGELYIGGVTLARGYLNAPGLTAERFLPDLHCDEPGARMYRSGDLARYLPDGNLEFIGRADHQVKLRGFRIEPDEIRVSLEGHPGVSQALVMVRDDAGGGRGLVAYVTGRDGQAPDPGELRRFLLDRLPQHMVPSAFVALSAFPLTPAGKVNRKALPPPTAVEPPARPVELPRTELERAIASVWCEVLEVPQVGLQDNFFDLGGHSLLMVQLRQRLAARLDRAVPVVDLFAHPTVSTLAEHLSAGPRGGELGDAERGSAAAAAQREARRRMAEARVRRSPASLGPKDDGGRQS